MTKEEKKLEELIIGLKKLHDEDKIRNKEVIMTILCVIKKNYWCELLGADKKTIVDWATVWKSMNSL